jgi:hypothetical protein
LTEILIQIILRRSSDINGDAKVEPQRMISLMSFGDVGSEKRRHCGCGTSRGSWGLVAADLQMAACAEIPSFKEVNAVLFDPHKTADWLKERYPVQDTAISRGE